MLLLLLGVMFLGSTALFACPAQGSKGKSGDSSGDASGNKRVELSLFR